MMEFVRITFFERVKAPSFGIFIAVIPGVAPVDEASEIFSDGPEWVLFFRGFGKTGSLAEDRAVCAGGGGGRSHEIRRPCLDGGLFLHHRDDIGSRESYGIEKRDGPIGEWIDCAAKEACGGFTEACFIDPVVIELRGQSANGDGGGVARVKAISEERARDRNGMTARA